MINKLKFFFFRHFVIFSKAQINATFATFCDYLTLIFFVEYFDLSATVAVAIGAFVGAVINFSLNRYFLFKSKNHLHHELIRYSLVSFIGLLLNSGTMWLLVNKFFFNYVIAKTLISVIVALLWNYPLHRYWVFRYDNESNNCVAKS